MEQKTERLRKKEDIEEEYETHASKKINFIILTIFLIFSAIVVGLSLGPVDISFFEVIQTLFGFAYNKAHGQIIWKIRMPRVLSGLFAGIALSLAGCVMQCILRNPLGSPFTLGISQAAVFGVAFAVIILGAGSVHSAASDAVLLNNPFIVTISAFVACLLCTTMILLLIKFKNARPETLILMGVILGSLFNALTIGLEYFADEIQLASIVFWTFGDLSRSTWSDFFLIIAIVIPALLFFIGNAWNYNVLNAGDETAESLGVNTERIRILGMIVACLTIAVIVSFFGIISFVGLIVPHIVRKIIGGDEKFLIPASALFGGFFLLIADTLARTIISPIVLPVGVLTSFLGAPMFLYLLIKKEERGFW
ncbi:MAG: iron ABC transporter permease [Promethearchaeia archaeon]